MFCLSLNNQGGYTAPPILNIISIPKPIPHFSWPAFPQLSSPPSQKIVPKAQVRKSQSFIHQGFFSQPAMRSGWVLRSRSQSFIHQGFFSQGWVGEDSHLHPPCRNPLFIKGSSLRWTIPDSWGQSPGRNPL